MSAAKFLKLSAPSLALVLALALGTGWAVTPAIAQSACPREPLTPAKAQSLATSPLSIASVGDSAGKISKFTVELASTAKEQEIGLMHRNVMAADHGMLFNFYEERRANFWMCHTFIPLDMLFIRSNGVIEAIKDNAVPQSETPIGPRQPVQAVLELVGGTAQKLGLKPGDTVRHVIFKNVAP